MRPRIMFLFVLPLWLMVFVALLWFTVWVFVLALWAFLWLVVAVAHLVGRVRRRD